MALVNPALYWLIIGVMLFFLEMALPGFILFFFALGALVTALVAWLVEISIAWQLALFIATSLGSLVGLRKVIQVHFFSSSVAGKDDDRDTVLAVAGEKGVVSMAIVPPAEGRIKYSGTSWRAVADYKIEEGEIVAIVRQHGLVIHVEKV